MRWVRGTPPSGPGFPSGRILVCHSDGSFRVWERQNGRYLKAEDPVRLVRPEDAVGVWGWLELPSLDQADDPSHPSRPSRPA